MTLKILLQKISRGEAKEVISFLQEKSFYMNSDFSCISGRFFSDMQKFERKILTTKEYSVCEVNTIHSLALFSQDILRKFILDAEEIKDYSFYLAKFGPSKSTPFCYVFTMTEKMLHNIFTQDIIEEFKKAQRYHKDQPNQWRPFVNGDKEDNIESLLNIVKNKSFPKLEILYIDESVNEQFPYLDSDLDDRMDQIFCVVDLISANAQKTPWFQNVKRLDSKRIAGVIAPRCESFSRNELSSLYQKNKIKLFSNILNKINKIDQELPELCEFDVTNSQNFKFKLTRAIKNKYPVLNTINGITKRPPNPSRS